MTDAVMTQPVELFERATRQAEVVMARVTSEPLTHPTPCSEWTVQQLIDHMIGGPDYLVSVVAGRDSSAACRRIDPRVPGGRFPSACGATRARGADADVPVPAEF